MIGKIRSVVLDTKHPLELANVYRGLLGGTVVEEDKTWSDAEGEDRFRVYRDPAGHTFCLVWGVTADDA